MPENHSPEADSPNTPAHDPSQPWPGIGRVEIPIPDSLRADPDDDVVLHDDIRTLASEADGCFCAVAALVVMLQRPDCEPADTGLVQQERQGLAELLDGVRLRLEGVVEISEQLVRVLVPEVA